MWVRPVAFLVCLVLIRVDDVGLGVLLQEPDDLEQRVRGQLGSAAQGSYELPSGHREGLVQRSGNARIRLRVRYLYPLVQARVARECLSGRTISADTQLPRRVNLAQHGVKRRLQPFRIWRRQHDAYQGPVPEARYRLAQTPQVGGPEAVVSDQRSVLLLNVGTTNAAYVRVAGWLLGFASRDYRCC